MLNALCCECGCTFCAQRRVRVHCVCVCVVFSVCGMVAPGSVWPQPGLSPVGASRGSRFSPWEVIDGVRGMWEMGHLRVCGADMGEFGGTQGGYKARGRLGNPVRVMGYPGKQCDTQRVRTLGRRLGAHPGDWGGPGLGGWWWLWGTHESCGTPKKGERAQERAETPQGAMGHPGGWENPGVYKAHGPSTAWTGLGSPKGLRGHPGKGMIAGSPQKVMLEPRPLTPPLLAALTEPLMGGTIRAHTEGPQQRCAGLSAGPHCGAVKVPARCTGTPSRQATRTCCCICRAR